jgi:hypothetical protein
MYREAFVKQVATSPKLRTYFVPPTKKRVMTVVDILAEHPELKANSLLMNVVRAYFEAYLNPTEFRS